MKNKYIWFTAVCIALIVYGLVSRYIAFDAIYRINRSKAEAAAACKVVAVAEKRAEYGPVWIV